MGEERIGLGGAAAVLDVAVETVRRVVDEGRLGAERDEEGAYTFSLSEGPGSPLFYVYARPWRGDGQPEPRRLRM